MVFPTPTSSTPGLTRPIAGNGSFSEATFEPFPATRCSEGHAPDSVTVERAHRTRPQTFDEGHIFLSGWACGDRERLAVRFGAERR